MSGVSFEDLLSYRDQETARWRDFFASNPAALHVACDIAKQKEVGGLVYHIFAVERLHTERLLEAPTTAFEAEPAIALEELYAVAADARGKLEKFMQTASEQELAKKLTFNTRSAGTVTASKRKLLTHILMHSARHWAQLAVLLRLAGHPQDWFHDFLFVERVS